MEININLYSSGYQGSGLFVNILHSCFKNLKINRTHNIDTPLISKNIYLYKDPRDTFFSIMEWKCRDNLNKNLPAPIYKFDDLIQYTETIWIPLYKKFINEKKCLSIQYENIFIDFHKNLNDIASYLNTDVENYQEKLIFYKNGQYFNRRIDFYKSFMTKKEIDNYNIFFKQYCYDYNINIWYAD